MKTEKIREKIKALEAELLSAERAEREARKAAISRAADRAGLLDFDLGAEVLDAEFRRLAERFRSASGNKKEAEDE